MATPADNPKPIQDIIPMTCSEQSFDRFLGFDVSKDTICVFDTKDQTTHTIDNTPARIRAFLKRADAGCYAICEPTGGYEAALLQALCDASIACHRANAMSTKAFQDSYGILAKTDAVDAKGLALYAKERWPSLARWTMPDKDLVRLQALVRRRQDLISYKVAEQNRSRDPADRCIKASCQAVIRVIDKQIAAIACEIDRLIAANQRMQKNVAVLTTLSGVGPVTAFSLTALMPELGTLTRRQAAALAGVAPHPRDSGKRSGYRRVRGGRSEVRATLFMAALAAARTKGPLGEFYKRLIKKGKLPMIALTALMRKIVVIPNARLRDAQLQ